MRQLSAWLFLCTVAATGAASAEIVSPSDVATRTRAAGKVVVARVLDVQARFESNRFGDQLIVSNALVEVLETWKGAQTALLRVAVEGGTVGDLTLKVSDLPALRAGDTAVFFLDAERNGVHLPHDRGKGILMLQGTGSLRVQGSTQTLDALRDQVRAAAPAQVGR